MGLIDLLDGTEPKILRPPFSYIGIKFRSLKNILPLLPLRDRYCEPFGGSGAVLISRQRTKHEIFNDRYAGVVAFYKCMRDPKLFQRLLDYINLMPWSREDFLEAKETWKNAADPVERAAKWYFIQTRSYMCKGETGVFNTLYPHDASLRKNVEKNFRAVHARMRNVIIENQDCFDCINRYDHEDTVFYMDPPYVGTHYNYSSGWNRDKLKKLLDLIFTLKGFVALSMYTDSTVESYDWDSVYSWKVNNGFADIQKRKGVRNTEFLFIKEAK